jgi:hypothetical protein
MTRKHKNVVQGAAVFVVIMGVCFGGGYWKARSFWKGEADHWKYSSDQTDENLRQLVLDQRESLHIIAKRIQDGTARCEPGKHKWHLGYKFKDPNSTKQGTEMAYWWCCECGMARDKVPPNFEDPRTTRPRESHAHSLVSLPSECDCAPDGFKRLLWELSENLDRHGPFHPVDP